MKTIVFTIYYLRYHGKIRRLAISEAKKKSFLASEMSNRGDSLLMSLLKFHSCLKINSRQEQNFILCFYIGQISGLHKKGLTEEAESCQTPLSVNPFFFRPVRGHQNSQRMIKTVVFLINLGCFHGLGRPPDFLEAKNK